MMIGNRGNCAKTGKGHFGKLGRFWEKWKSTVQMIGESSANCLAQHGSEKEGGVWLEEEDLSGGMRPGAQRSSERNYC